MNKFKLVLVAITTVISFTNYVAAVEAIPRGQIQFQLNYDEPELQSNSSNWSVSMVDNYVGVTVVEQVNGSSFMGHWQAGIDPLSDSTDVQLEQQQSYLNWRTGYFSLWGGRLSTIEKDFLIDPARVHYSLAGGGMAVGGLVPVIENKAVRLDVSAGDYLTFSSQWKFDETQPGTVSFATTMITPEGRISATYRKTDNETDQWGTQLSYQVNTLVFTGAWLYQGETLAWDISTRALVNRSQTIIAYSQVADEEGRWSAGIQQVLSEYVTSYSEVIWQPGGKDWTWSNGFQLKF